MRGRGYGDRGGRGGRGGFVGRGRGGAALQRFAFVRELQSNSTMRLMRDYKELTKPDRIPLVGVSAAPIPN
jgi:ubiquitin-protein ligase